MDRLDWMYLRALLPSGVVLAFAFVLAWVLKDIGASPLLFGLAAVPRWVFLGGVILASGMALGPLYRFWLWHRGEGLMCPNCGGPLGDRIDGPLRSLLQVPVLQRQCRRPPGRVNPTTSENPT